MAKLFQMSGFDLLCDLTPRWWRKPTRSVLRDRMPAVIAKIVETASFVRSIEYDVVEDKFVVRCIIPADMALKTMMDKREQVLAELDALAP